MAHLKRDRDKLLARTKKIRGQLNAVEEAIAEGEDCSTVLMTLAACHRRSHGLMIEILEGSHPRPHRRSRPAAGLESAVRRPRS